jgi:hypothetical protein
MPQRQKRLLFHAIPPSPDRPQAQWGDFLRDAALLPLPADAEQLAENTWLLPDDGKSYLLLGRLGHQHATETRVLPFFPASAWQRLSPPG